MNLPGIIVLIILILLAGINAIGGILYGYSGPFIAFIFYLIIAFLCWKKSHFQAAIIAGLFGFAVHLYEIFFSDINDANGINRGFLYVNLLLPILLIYFGYKANKVKDVP